MTDYADYQTPQAHASAIASTGAPLLRLTGAGTANNSQTLGGASSVNLLTALPWSQPGWEVTILLNLPAAAGTKPWAVLAFTWLDPSGVYQTGSDNVILTAGNGPTNALLFFGRGPAKGGQLTLVLQNIDPAQTLTYSWGIFPASNVWGDTRWKQLSYAATAPVGFSNPGGDPVNGIIAAIKPTLVNGSPQSRLIALANGEWSVATDNSGQANSVTVTIADASSVNLSTLPQFDKCTVAAGATDRRELWIPARPVLVTMTDNAAGNITPLLTVTVRDLAGP